MGDNNIWTNVAQSRLLHVLPQETHHGDAEIRGSKEALLRLASALVDAAEMAQGGEAKIEMMAADGEGYWIILRPMSDQQMNDGPLPYAQIGHLWDFSRCFDCPKDKAVDA